MVGKMSRVHILIIASTLAMIGLVIFQYKWITHSRELYDEIFHQRACMALCSTLEEYGEGAVCSDVNCSTACEIIDHAHGNAFPAKPFEANELFHTDLRKSLDFYNIDLNYQLTQTTEQPASMKGTNAPTCIVSLPAEDDQAESFIALEFPGQRREKMEKLSFMIAASVAILLFTALVLLLANWWLMKQKLLLQTNMEIYNNMAHEFRTPLTNISLASRMLSGKTGQQDGKLVDIISRENTKLMGQVERVLHLARLDNGDYDLKNEVIRLAPLIDAVKEELSMQIEERQATIKINIPPGFEIFGDRQHLANVFRNLIDNALKYTDTRPEIMIRADEEKHGVMIHVQDNGIGIPAGQSALIFEKFQRVHQGNLHAVKGFGLGLTYVKKIVELHKGTVRVSSEVNKGSCFHVFIPKMA